MEKHEFVFQCGDKEEKVVVYVTSKLHQELVNAVFSAANELNKKQKGKDKASSILNMILSKYSYDKIVLEDDIIPSEEQDSPFFVDLKVEDGGMIVCFTFAGALDEKVKSELFQKTITMFQRTQIINYSGLFF